jgi:2-dehydro-3-deoxygluconokinase
MMNGSGSGSGVQRDAGDDVRRRMQWETRPEGRPAPLVVVDPEEIDPVEAAARERWERQRDLTSLGECLVEMTRRSDGAYHPAIAGDAFNTLFYASRLGLRTGLVSAIGDDLFTPMIVERINAEGIDLSNVRRLSGRHNGIYFVENDSWGERRFHYWRENSAATETLAGGDLARIASYLLASHAVLITGVTLAVFKEPERLRELLARVHARTTIVLDPNYRARLWSSSQEFRFRIETIMPFVDVYLPSRQDLESAWRGSEPIDLLRAARDAGVRLIAMKDGANGCAMLVDDELVSVPPVDGLHVVDTTGAGDAFDAGVIAGLLRGATLRDACDLGQRVASRTLMVPGAIDPGFTPHAIDAGWRAV